MSAPKELAILCSLSTDVGFGELASLFKINMSLVTTDPDC